MEQLDGVWRAVEHGGLVLGPGANPIAARAHRRATGRHSIGSASGSTLMRVTPSSNTNRKAIAVHVRGIASSDPGRAYQILREADDLAQSLGLHVRRGKALREAEAVRQDKGSALREIFERSGARSVFFAGDDLTDFPAIDFAAEHGIGAFVCSEEQRGRPSTSAVLLQSVDEVSAVLSQFLQRITE